MGGEVLHRISSCYPAIPSGSRLGWRKERGAKVWISACLLTAGGSRHSWRGMWNLAVSRVCLGRELLIFRSHSLMDREIFRYFVSSVFNMLIKLNSFKIRTPRQTQLNRSGWTACLLSDWLRVESLPCCKDGHEHQPQPAISLKRGGLMQVVMFGIFCSVIKDTPSINPILSPCLVLLGRYSCRILQVSL